MNPDDYIEAPGSPAEPMADERPAVLLVDDEEEFGDDLQLLLGDLFDITCVPSAEEARHFLQAHSAQSILLDIDLGEHMDGLTFLDILQADYPEIPVIMVSKDRSIETVTRAMKQGADGYIGKQPAREELVTNLNTVMELKRSRLHIRALQEKLGSLSELVGNSPFMVRLRQEVDRYASFDSPVTITGESGTGKEFVARAIHNHSKRKDRPFVTVNCAAFGETLLESELFGHEQGAFAGADHRRVGRLQEVGAGTLYLDEIADMSLETQVKLLRVLADRRFRPLGSQQEIPFRARLIIASNRDLVQEVRDRRFRQDLFFRINVLRLHLPPLRERVEDIEPLVHMLIYKKATEMKRSVPSLDGGALRLLQSQSWPGNVRELGSVIENALCHCPGAHLTATDFGQLKRDRFDGLSYNDARRKAIDEFQREYIAGLMRATRGNVTAAANLADIPRQTLHRIMRDLGIRREDFRQRTAQRGA
jgi:DNA-binding NtrC family response regulator